MRLARVILVIADISGYTRFIRHRAISLLHAEQIVTELLESVIDNAEHPLILNKLQGDAALLYSEVGTDATAAATDVLTQVRKFFAGFDARVALVRETRSNCSCDACANVNALQLKAFLHVGEIAIKQVRQFEELAGEDVILAHRLLKNSVPAREYVLLTDDYRKLLRIDLAGATRLEEHAEGIGDVVAWVLSREHLRTLALPPRPAAAPAAKSATKPPPSGEEPRFAHLPNGGPNPFRLAWDTLVLGIGHRLQRKKEGGGRH